MADELKEITKVITQMGVHVENIKEDISEMKEDRKKTSEKFWNNINAMNDSINEEKLDRVGADNEIKTDVVRMTTKLGIITGGIAVAVSAFMIWLEGAFRN